MMMYMYIYDCVGAVNRLIDRYVVGEVIIVLSLLFIENECQYIV